MPFELIQGNLLELPVDAIVNPANSALLPGGGVCGQIFHAAKNRRALERTCEEIGYCPTGQAVCTESYGLTAPYVIHAVGPIWQGGNCGEAELLVSCYRNAMECALRQGCRSIAFPLISAGIFGYPKVEAFQIAISAITAFLEAHDLQVYLVFRHGLQQLLDQNRRENGWTGKE